MNLMIVEDSALVLQQLQRLIGGIKGIRVTGTAADEEGAVFMITLSPPDVVLLDLSLATGTGLKVLQWIRGSRFAGRVIVLTNHTSDSVRQACMKFGIDGFYDKSSEVQNCLDHLSSWVGQ